MVESACSKDKKNLKHIIPSIEKQINTIIKHYNEKYVANESQKAEFCKELFHQIINVSFIFLFLY